MRITRLERRIFMVQLDYRTKNPRWGIKGMVFKNWESYSFTLGYLSNLKHYTNTCPHTCDADISIHIEANEKQGAWNKEGRIHYYGSIKRLQTTFDDLYVCSSSGKGNVTKRIDSNDYIYSLINDYGFQIQTYPGYTTADVFPPSADIVEHRLRDYLKGKLTDEQINVCVSYFISGYNL